MKRKTKKSNNKTNLTSLLPRNKKLICNEKSADPG